MVTDIFRNVMPPFKKNPSYFPVEGCFRNQQLKIPFQKHEEKETNFNLLKPPNITR